MDKLAIIAEVILLWTPVLEHRLARDFTGRSSSSKSGMAVTSPQDYSALSPEKEQCRKFASCLGDPQPTSSLSCHHSGGSSESCVCCTCGSTQMPQFSIEGHMVEGAKFRLLCTNYSIYSGLFWC
jgi:hypothetical protein